MRYLRYLGRGRRKYFRRWDRRYGILYSAKVRKNGVSWLDTYDTSLSWFEVPYPRRSIFSGIPPFKRRRYFKSFKASLWTREVKKR